MMTAEPKARHRVRAQPRRDAANLAIEAEQDSRCRYGGEAEKDVEFRHGGSPWTQRETDSGHEWFRASQAAAGSGAGCRI